MSRMANQKCDDRETNRWPIRIKSEVKETSVGQSTQGLCPDISSACSISLGPSNYQNLGALEEVSEVGCSKLQVWTSMLMLCSLH